MRATVSKPLIFVVISLLVALVYSSMSAFNVFAVPNEAPGTAECKVLEQDENDFLQRCCWTETDPGDPEGIELYYCQICDRDNCGNKYPDPRAGPAPPPSGPAAPLQGGVLEQPPTSQPFDPAAPLQGGVLEQLEQGDFSPGFAPGFLQQQEQLPPPAAEETQPATVEEEQPVPVCEEGLEFNKDLGFCVPTECPEGQELNEETGICVLEEQPAAADQPEEQERQTEDEQPSEESGSEEENGNN